MATVEVQILQGVASVGGLAISAGITYLVNAINKNVKSKSAQDIITGLGSIADSVVQDFNQKVVSQAKANGVFTPQLAASVKQDAVQAVLSQGSALVKLGEKSVGNMQALVSSLIEQAVARNNAFMAHMVQAKPKVAEPTPAPAK